MKQYQQRRQQLFDTMPASSLAILPAASEILRNGDSPYPFRQSSDFYYLTGYNEPDSVALFIKNNEGALTFMLGVRPKDPSKEIWDGPRSGLDGAQSQFGADHAFDIHELDEVVEAELAQVKTLYYPMSQFAELDASIHEWILNLKKGQRAGVQVPNQFLDLAPIVHEMRLIKDEHEVELMKKAAEISANAHLAVMKQLKPGIFEHELEATFVHECMKKGGKHMAYTPIVGGGKNACVLHYNANDQKIEDGDLLLIDAGCEYGMYAADITRTYPAGKSFTPEQKAIYELVLKAQCDVIDMIKPGVCWNSLYEKTCEILTEGLIELGLLSGSLEENLENKSFTQFFMHKTGHFIGLDVHDAGAYKNGDSWIKLKAGMAFTVEPGLYILPETGVDEKWWHIGVRIEDDVLVTDSGCVNLTAAVPKSVEDIEAIRHGS